MAAMMSGKNALLYYIEHFHTIPGDKKDNRRSGHVGSRNEKKIRIRTLLSRVPQNCCHYVR